MFTEENLQKKLLEQIYISHTVLLLLLQVSESRSSSRSHLSVEFWKTAVLKLFETSLKEFFG